MWITILLNLLATIVVVGASVYIYRLRGTIESLNETNESLQRDIARAEKFFAESENRSNEHILELLAESNTQKLQIDALEAGLQRATSSNRRLRKEIETSYSHLENLLKDPFHSNLRQTSRAVRRHKQNQKESANA